MFKVMAMLAHQLHCAERTTKEVRTDVHVAKAASHNLEG